MRPGANSRPPVGAGPAPMLHLADTTNAEQYSYVIDANQLARDIADASAYDDLSAGAFGSHMH